MKFEEIEKKSKGCSVMHFGSELAFLIAVLPRQDHSAMMCYNPTCGGVPPTFYETYVRQIQD